MFYQIFSVMAPVLTAALAGFIWAKINPKLNTDSMGKLVINLATPCLIIYALSQAELSPQLLLDISLAAVLIMLASGLLAWGFCRLLGANPRVYIPGVVFSNNGNLGLPICLFAFGQQGLALAVAYFVVVALAHFSVGIMLFSGRLDFKSTLKSPISWAAVVGLALQFSSSDMPLWLENSLGFMGNVANPLMLIMLGASLAGIAVHGLLRPGIFALLRVWGGAAIGWLVSTLLNLDGLTQAVVILQASTASAAINFLLAKMYLGDGQEMAALVFSSTLLALVSIALLLPWLIPLAS